MSHRISDLRRYLDGKRPVPELAAKRKSVKNCARSLQQDAKSPSYLPRRVIYYTRFADDFVVVLCDMSKAEAVELRDATAHWLWQTLGLTLNMDKTLVTHWQKRLRFLGYQLQGRRSSRGTLLAPSERTGGGDA